MNIPHRFDAPGSKCIPHKQGPCEQSNTAQQPARTQKKTREIKKKTLAFDFSYKPQTQKHMQTNPKLISQFLNPKSQMQDLRSRTLGQMMKRIVPFCICRPPLGEIRVDKPECDLSKLRVSARLNGSRTEEDIHIKSDHWS